MISYHIDFQFAPKQKIRKKIICHEKKNILHILTSLIGTAKKRQRARKTKMQALYIGEVDVLRILLLLGSSKLSV